MSLVELLVKSITLLYRESQLEEKGTDSKDLVMNTIQEITAGRKNSVMTDNDLVVDTMIDLLVEMCATEEEYDSVNILQKIKLVCNGDSTPYEAVKNGIVPEITVSDSKRLIINTVRNLNNYFKEKKIGDLLRKANYEFTFKRHGIKSANDFVESLVTNLEAMELQRGMKDPAVMTDFDLGDTSTLTSLLAEVKSKGNGKSKLKTGWKHLNETLQGGFSRGDSWVMPALQHKYKTGFTLSLFCQIALENKPYMLNEKKKPLLLRISFEDDATNNLQFMYLYLKHGETMEPVSIENVSDVEMASYIKEKLGVNGYHIKMMRVDPTMWSFKDIFNRVLALEAEGYEVHLLMLDYLGMIPTTGCITSGAMGSDIRDLFRRVRNFTSIKGITMISPHQVSPSGKSLLRSGIPNELFVKEINGKGHYAGCSTIDQDVDGELYLHLAYVKKKWYLTVQLGKHRIPTVIPEEKKFLMLPFTTKGMPIPPDVHLDKPISVRDLKDIALVDGDSDFDF